MYPAHVNKDKTLIANLVGIRVSPCPFLLSANHLEIDTSARSPNVGRDGAPARSSELLRLMLVASLGASWLELVGTHWWQAGLVVEQAEEQPHHQP